LEFFLLSKPAALAPPKGIFPFAEPSTFYRYSSGGSSGSYNLTWIAAAAFRR
jgi:hypothetical protein